MRIVVTGGAGFIGSNLCRRLLEDGCRVVCVDNLSTGHLQFLDSIAGHADFEFVELDLLARDDALEQVFTGSTAVAHLAANADVRFGWDHPERDLQQNVVASLRVLEAVRRAAVPSLLFTSTGSVYGEAAVIPTPETCPFPVQTSLYAASKLAVEGFVQAYAEKTGLRTVILRFVSVLGPHYTHGHVIDFVRSLRHNASHLRVLGDGSQRKSYLDVADCVRAVSQLILGEQESGVFNLGTDDTCTVRESVGWICRRLGVSPTLEFTGGRRGWVGDNPHIHLAIDRILATGWRPDRTIRESIESTVDWLVTQDWLLDEREPRLLSPDQRR
jgi:UDP-glucose 4-epimerase